MSDLVDINDRLNAAADKAENGAQIIHDVANGDEDTEVQTESGTIPTLAKVVRYLNENLGGSVDAAVRDALSSLAEPSGSENIGFSPDATGLISQSIAEALRAGSVNIMQFGAAGIGGDDTLAIQKAVDYAANSGKALYAPAGSYGLKNDITIANKNFTIVGEGTGLTKFWMDHAGKGFVYSSTDRTQKLTVYGVEVITSNANAISGFDIKFPVTSAVDQSQLSMTDVAVRTSGSGTFNYACVRLEGVKNPFLDKVVTRGTMAATLYGIALEGQTIDAHLSECRAYLVDKGIYISGANEGTAITGYTAVSVKTGIDVNPDNGGPWISISNFHINSSERGIRVNRRTQVKINNGLLYANNLFGSTSWTGIDFGHDDGKFAEYCDVDGVIFNRQNFSGATIGINYKNSRYCNATNCSFVNIAQPFVEDAASNSNLRFLNQYPGITHPLTKNGLSGGEALRINTANFPQNRVVVSGGPTGSSPSIAAEGVDSTIGFEVNGKGPNAPVSIGSVGAGTGFQVLIPANTVNRPRAVGGVAGSPATFDATGSDALIWLALRGKGAAGIMLPATVSANYASDAAAASAGVPIGGVYHTGGALKIRLT